jgi:hypothetical protein
MKYYSQRVWIKFPNRRQKTNLDLKKVRVEMTGLTEETSDLVIPQRYPENTSIYQHVKTQRKLKKL